MVYDAVLHPVHYDHFNSLGITAHAHVSLEILFGDHRPDAM